MKKTSSGFSLIEIMVALGILSIISLAVMSMIQNSNRSLGRLRDSAELENVVNLARYMLNNGESCIQSFSGPRFEQGLAPGATLVDQVVNVKNAAGTEVVRFQKEGAHLLPGTLNTKYRVLKVDFTKDSETDSTYDFGAGGEPAVQVFGRYAVQFGLFEGGEVTSHTRQYEIPIGFLIKKADNTIRRCSSTMESKQAACIKVGGTWDATTPAIPDELRCIPEQTCLKLGTYSNAPTTDGGHRNMYTNDYTCPYDGSSASTTYDGSGPVKRWRIGSISSNHGCGKNCVEVINAPLIECRRCPSHIAGGWLTTPEPATTVSTNDANSGDLTTNTEPTSGY